MKNLIFILFPLLNIFGGGNIDKQTYYYYFDECDAAIITAPRILSEEDSIRNTAIELTKKAEGLRLQAYWDYKQWTIGYGVKAENRHQKISVEEADSMFLATFEKVEAQVREEFPNLEGSKFYATVMFAYNVSIHQIKRANVTPKKLANGEKPPFLAWVHVTKDGKKTVLEGLVNRRAMESQFWDNWRDYT